MTKLTHKQEMARRIIERTGRVPSRIWLNSGKYPPAKLREIRARKVNWKGEIQR